MRTLILCGLIMLLAAAQDGWKTEIDNSLVRVSRRAVAPHGTISGVEMPPALLVFLTDYSVSVTGSDLQRQLEGKAGEVLWHPGGRIRVANLSGDRLEVAQVAPKFRPEPSYELPAMRSPYNARFENDRIRVRRFRMTARRAVEERRAPGVVLFLDSAHIRLTRAGGRVEELWLKPGQMRFEPGGSFVFENLGDVHEVMWFDLKTSKQVLPAAAREEGR